MQILNGKYHAAGNGSGRAERSRVRFSSRSVRNLLQPPPRARELPHAASCQRDSHQPPLPRESGPRVRVAQGAAVLGQPPTSDGDSHPPVTGTSCPGCSRALAPLPCALHGSAAGELREAVQLITRIRLHYLKASLKYHRFASA